ADSGAVREQVLHRDVVPDQWEIVPEQGSRRRRQLEHAVSDQARNRERGQPLRPARDPELRVEPVRDRMAPVGEPVGDGKLDTIPAIDADDAGEPGPGGEDRDFAEHLLEPHDAYFRALRDLLRIRW